MRRVAMIMAIRPCFGSVLFLLAVSPLMLTCEHRRHPDVIVISLDTVRGDALRQEPGSDELPALSRLQREGVTFDSAYATTPFTLSSHLTLMTGTSARIHRVRHRRRRLSDRIDLLPEFLQQAGYSTFGVYNSELLGPEFGFGRGFDTWVVQGGGAEAVRTRAEELLLEATQDGKPIFMFVHFYDAHSDPHVASKTVPYDSPPGYGGEPRAGAQNEFCDSLGRCATDYLLACNKEGVELSDGSNQELRRLYLAGVRYLEHQVDLLLQRLIDDGIWNDALVILTADHGEELGEHGMYLHDQLFEEIVRVPLIVRFPGGRALTERGDDSVMLEDILPTVLDVAGLAVPDQPWLEGQSLLSSSGEEDSSRLVLAQEIKRHSRYAVRQGNYKLHFERNGPILALYDISKDPEEQNDLSRDLLSLAESLREQAEIRLEEQDYHASDVGGVPLLVDPESDAEARERLEALGYLQ